MKTQPVLKRWRKGVLAALAAIGGTVQAADHRDGPRIANNTPTLGSIDINDVYLFRAPHNADRTAMIMTLSAAAGVVGPAQFLPGAIYEFRVDNNGDTVSEVVFQLVFSAPNAQGRQNYSLQRLSTSPVPFDGVIATGTTSIGADKTFRFSPLAGNGGVTAGLFRDPFFFDLLAFNKFIAAADAQLPLAQRVAPFFPPNFPNNFFGNYNVIGIVLEVPSVWLRSSPKHPNIAVWCRTLADVGDGRGFNQYDRMGIPAINTAVIQPGMPRTAPPGPVVPANSTLDEDNFNFLTPSDDAALRPIASARIQFAYGVTPTYAAGVAAFVLPDQLPLNTLLYTGFPNGRQLANDVIDTEFQLLTDNALKSDRVGVEQSYRAAFPYLSPPLPRASTLAAMSALNAADSAAQGVQP